MSDCTACEDGDTGPTYHEVCAGVRVPVRPCSCEAGREFAERVRDEAEAGYERGRTR